jgi:t-SNARE complex subunit (syntaxin)
MDQRMSSNELLKAQSARKGPQMPEFNISARTRVMNYVRIIREGLLSLRKLKDEYMAVNDETKEKALKEEMDSVGDTISKSITCVNKMLKSMRKDVAEQRKQEKDPSTENTNVRFLETTIASVQVKLYEMVHTFNMIQLDLKSTFKTKMKRKMFLYAPNSTEEEMTELLNDPAVSPLENEQLHPAKHVQA